MTEIIVALIAGAFSLLGALGGAWCANRKSTALIAYRIEQLEVAQKKYNNLQERTHKLEESDAVQTEQIKVVNHRLANLEKAKP